MGIPNVFGIENKGIFRGQATGLASYDTSGTAYLPGGQTSQVINCGYITDSSIVDVNVIAVPASTVIPLVEVLASRVTSTGIATNGSFTVKLQDATAPVPDVFFNWRVINV